MPGSAPLLLLHSLSQAHLLRGGGRSPGLPSGRLGEDPAGEEGGICAHGGVLSWAAGACPVLGQPAPWPHTEGDFSPICASFTLSRGSRWF